MASYKNADRRFKIFCCIYNAIILMTERKRYEAFLIWVYHNFSIEYNLDRNSTQSMAISKQPLRCKLSVNNKAIDQVRKFNYLGAETPNDRNLTSEVRTQANWANRVSTYLRNMPKDRCMVAEIRL